jgi:hypothetical protein
VAIVVEQETLVLGRLPQLVTQLLGVLERWIEILPQVTRGIVDELELVVEREGGRGTTHELVLDLLRQRLKLTLKILANLLDYRTQSRLSAVMVQHMSCVLYSRAFSGRRFPGSTQHSSFAHGLVLTMSGGSTAMLRQMTSAAACVLSRDLSRQSSCWPAETAARAEDRRSVVSSGSGHLLHPLSHAQSRLDV